MQIENPTTPSSLRYLKGVGPKRAVALEKIGVASIRDLFYLFPRRYEDRSQLTSIENLQPNQTATIRGNILAIKLKRLRRMKILEVMVGDATGMISVLWFNQAYLANQLKENDPIIVYGKVELYKEKLQITSPEFEIVDEDIEDTAHTGRITPIYPLTEGLFQKSLRRTIKEALEQHLEATVSEFLPNKFRQEQQLIDLQEALLEIHFPTSFDRLDEARKRLVFDELFLFELLLIKRMRITKTKHKAHSLNPANLLAEYQETLPFEMTESQVESCLQIAKNCENEYPMNRLLHGDVGAGKTVVAAFAMLLAAKNNKQSALLVPTEILAEQHYKTLKSLLKPFSINPGLITSSIAANKREKMTAELKQGKLSILIGTHALLSEDVQFEDLALLIVDEQHKFGVHQRSQLLNTDPRPHHLVMTATPIPRTLALTVFGDLDISTMKHLPKGRKPIKTYWITRKKQTAVLEHIREKIQQGEQAYFVFPIIEESEKVDLLAATKEFERLQAKVFKEFKMGLIHGRTSQEERDAIMKSFLNNETKILVSTTVIEVGVDNPNATMMVIENAERFGLSQLHQLRGRIGRGHIESECFLFGEPKTEEGQKRLRILTKTMDGFKIAEEDLKLRGPGDFLGTRQSGAPLFRIADPLRDQEALVFARETAKDLIDGDILENDPLWAPTHQRLEEYRIHY